MRHVDFEKILHDYLSTAVDLWYCGVNYIFNSSANVHVAKYARIK